MLIFPSGFRFSMSQVGAIVLAVNNEPLQYNNSKTELPKIMVGSSGGVCCMDDNGLSVLVQHSLSNEVSKYISLLNTT